MAQVTDPLLLRQLETPATSPNQITDPAILLQLEYALPTRLPSFTRGPQDNGFVETAALRGGGAVLDAVTDPLAFLRHMVSPQIEAVESQSTVGKRLADAALQARGGPYQPTTPGGQVGMSAATGAAAGSPFGIPGMMLGGAAGAASELARQYAPQLLPGISENNTERLAAGAGLVPGLLAGAAARPPRPAVPTATELIARGGAGFDATRQSGVDFSTSPLLDMAHRMRASLFEDGFESDMIPGTTKALNTIIESAAPTAEGSQPVATFGNLHTVRRRLDRIISNNISGPNANKDDAAAAARVKSELDTLIGSMGDNPQYVVGGTPEAAAQASTEFRTALGNYSQGMKANALTGELDRNYSGVGELAEKQAQAANSGMNFDNSLRQRMKQFLTSRRNVSGYTDAELGLLDRVVEGSGTQNFLRWLGNTVGGGGGPIAPSAGAAVGATVAGAPGAIVGGVIPGTIGRTVKNFENALARRNLNRATEAILMNSPEFQARLAQMPPRDAAVLQGLLRGGLLGGAVAGF